MLSAATRDELSADLDRISADGLFKDEVVLSGAQGSRIRLADGRQVLNMCANNYLGLATHPEVAAAARTALERWGYGMASVRFICGTQQLHRDLEVRISEFLGTEDTILYSSCFDANAGLFETILGKEDVVISDALNHASIIDGIRLSKARRERYPNRDLDVLGRTLSGLRGTRRTMIATDGVFSMDGYLADLDGICTIAEQHGSLVMVDDSHAVGFIGERGRGTPELHQVTERVDVITGTLGKALGGASGGYTSGRKEIIALLRQRSRPYLFSNALAPMIAAASLRAIDLIEGAVEARTRLIENTALFRRRLAELGFDVLPGTHPIVPIMFGDAALAKGVAHALLDEGVLAVAFSYPVVPLGEARIRAQVSALHTPDQLLEVAEAFSRARESDGLRRM